MNGKLVRCSIVVFLAWLSVERSGAEPAEDAVDASAAMMGFHEAPSREAFEGIQAAMAAHLPVYESEEDGVATLAATFLARVNEKHGWPFRDLGRLDDLAREITTRADTEIARFVNDDGWVSPTKLDVWWSSFFATGDTGYLDRIVAQLREPDEVESDPTAQPNLVAAAARWSLASNAGQQPAVMRHLRALLAADPPPKEAAWLRPLVASAARARPLELPPDQETACTVTGSVKIVTQDVTPGLDRASFLAKPKTLYRKGMHRMRMEEQPDPEQGIHGLIVARDRDSWMVNLANGSGRHFVDREESYDMHVPLTPTDWPPSLVGLEFGCELDFMKNLGVVPGTLAEGANLEYAIKSGDARVTLVVDAATGKPTHYALHWQGEVVSVIAYRLYDTSKDLPKSLFTRPAGITYEEGNPLDEPTPPPQ